MKKSHFSRNISRRDFLNGTSIGVGSMLLGVGAPNALSSARRNAPAPLSVKTGTAMAGLAITLYLMATPQTWSIQRTAFGAVASGS